jgi:hypothetical protein
VEFDTPSLAEALLRSGTHLYRLYSAAARSQFAPKGAGVCPMLSMLCASHQASKLHAGSWHVGRCSSLTQPPHSLFPPAGVSQSAPAASFCDLVALTHRITTPAFQDLLHYLTQRAVTGVGGGDAAPENDAAAGNEGGASIFKPAQTSCCRKMASRSTEYPAGSPSADEDAAARKRVRVNAATATRLKRDSRLIPALVFQMEDFEKLLIKLSKKGAASHSRGVWPARCHTAKFGRHAASLQSLAGTLPHCKV